MTETPDAKYYRPRIDANRFVTSSTRAAAFAESSVIGLNVETGGIFFGPGTSRVQRNLNGFGFGEPALDLGGQQIVDEPFPLFLMWRTRNQRHHVGHDRHAHAVPIWQDHGDWLLCLDRNVDVVGVGQPDGDVAARDHVANHRIAVNDFDVIGFELPKVLIGTIVADFGVQRRHMKRSGTEAGVGYRDLPLPARLRQIEHRAGRRIRRDF
jgi:hypothetical protein